MSNTETHERETDGWGGGKTQISPAIKRTRRPRRDNRRRRKHVTHVPLDCTLRTSPTGYLARQRHHYIHIRFPQPLDGKTKSYPVYLLPSFPGETTQSNKIKRSQQGYNRITFRWSTFLYTHFNPLRTTIRFSTLNYIDI